MLQTQIRTEQIKDGAITSPKLSTSTATVATDDKVLIQDTSDSDNLKTVTAQSIADLGGGASSAITITAGENLAERDIAYLDYSTNTYFKVDTDATSAIDVSGRIVVVSESGGITSASTGSAIPFGELDGFTGLTAGLPIYASATAGGYTQTKPNISSGGGQIAIVNIGYALSTTKIFVDPQPIRYIKRETLANDGTLTIEHHSDAQSRQREVQSYVGTTADGATLTSYASSNQDTDISLEGPVLAGDSLNLSGSGTTAGLGDVSGAERRAAQSITTVNGGNLTQFTVDFSSDIGSPTGDATWTIEADSSGDPSGVALTTGTFTPTSSATNTINLSSGEQIILEPATIYWIVFTVPAQGTNDRYRIVRSSSSVYAGGLYKYSDDGGSWTDDGGTDLDMTFTISATNEYDKLAQGFQVTGTQTVKTARLWLKKVASPPGTLTVRIETDNTSDPSGTLADANLTTTVAESSLATSYGYIDFTFSTSASISGSTPYWIVLSTSRAQSDTNYISWGADTSSPSYADGEAKSEASSTWSSLTADFVFELIGEGTQFDEPAVIGRWSGGTRDIAVRFDDGSGSDPNTKTTFKNVSGGTLDIVAEVEVT